MKALGLLSRIRGRSSCRSVIVKVVGMVAGGVVRLL